MADRRRRRPSDEHSGDELTEDSSPIRPKERPSECESEGEHAAEPELSEYESANDESREVEEEEEEEEESEEDDEEDEDEDEETEEEESGEDELLEDETSVVDEERQSGDGEEQPDEVLDDDEDKKNPAYVPRKGAFYEHDLRLDMEGVERPRDEKKGTKKLWKDDGRWDHDRFHENEQAPKSREELIAMYGYDITTADKPPDAPPKSNRPRRPPRERKPKLNDFMGDTDTQYSSGNDSQPRRRNYRSEGPRGGGQNYDLEYPLPGGRRNYDDQETDYVQRNSYNSNRGGGIYGNRRGRGRGRGNSRRGYSDVREDRSPRNQGPTSPTERAPPARQVTNYGRDYSSYKGDRNYGESSNYRDVRESGREVRSNYRDMKANYRDARENYRDTQENYRDSRDGVRDNRDNYKDSRDRETKESYRENYKDLSYRGTRKDNTNYSRDSGSRDNHRSNYSDSSNYSRDNRSNTNYRDNAVNRQHSNEVTIPKNPEGSVPPKSYDKLVTQKSYYTISPVTDEDRIPAESPKVAEMERIKKEPMEDLNITVSGSGDRKSYSKDRRGKQTQSRPQDEGKKVVDSGKTYHAGGESTRGRDEPSHGHGSNPTKHQPTLPPRLQQQERNKYAAMQSANAAGDKADSSQQGRSKRYSSQRQRAGGDVQGFPDQGQTSEGQQQFYNQNFNQAVLPTQGEKKMMAVPPPPPPGAPPLIPPAMNFPSIPVSTGAIRNPPMAGPPRPALVANRPPATMATSVPIIPQPPMIGPGVIYGAPPTAFQLSTPLPMPQFPTPPTAPPPAPPPPVPQSQPHEVVRGGTTYYAHEGTTRAASTGTTYYPPAMQYASPHRSPVRRPKAAIPIINPQDIKKSNKDGEEMLEAEDEEMEEMEEYEDAVTEPVPEGDDYKTEVTDTIPEISANLVESEHEKIAPTSDTDTVETQPSPAGETPSSVARSESEDLQPVEEVVRVQLEKDVVKREPEIQQEVVKNEPESPLDEVVKNEPEKLPLEPLKNEPEIPVLDVKKEPDTPVETEAPVQAIEAVS